MDIYLYGLNDDLHVAETSDGDYLESYTGVELLMDGDEAIWIHYEYFDGWTVEIMDEVPEDWWVKVLAKSRKARSRGGQFIHVRVPDGEAVYLSERGENNDSD